MPARPYNHFSNSVKGHGQGRDFYHVFELHDYPTLTYSDRLTLHYGGREFRFMSMVGDADGTTVLYLPKKKILITGDVIS